MESKEKSKNTLKNKGQENKKSKNTKFSDILIEQSRLLPNWLKQYPELIENQKKKLDEMYELMEGSRAMHLYGKGRSANSAISLALRLKHFGYNVWFIGDVVKERIKTGDVVILFSGSGETSDIVDVAKKSRRDGASIIAITSYEDSTLAKNSNIVFCLPGGMEKRKGWDYLEAQITKESTLESFFYGGGEFETISYLFQETVVSAIGKYKKIPGSVVVAEHERDEVMDSE